MRAKSAIRKMSHTLMMQRYLSLCILNNLPYITGFFAMKLTTKIKLMLG